VAQRVERWRYELDVVGSILLGTNVFFFFFWFIEPKSQNSRPAPTSIEPLASQAKEEGAAHCA